jgi:hypothetical protein
MPDGIEQKIRERAYHLWRENGGGEGDADRHWLAAEREVLAAFAVSASPTTPRPRGGAAKDAPRPEPKAKPPASRAAGRRAS